MIKPPLAVHAGSNTVAADAEMLALPRNLASRVITRQVPTPPVVVGRVIVVVVPLLDVTLKASCTGMRKLGVTKSTVAVPLVFETVALAEADMLSRM